MADSVSGSKSHRKNNKNMMNRQDEAVVKTDEIQTEQV